MALITCPECGGQVSDQATVCIHCGYPIREMIKQQKCDELQPQIDVIVRIAKIFVDTSTAKFPDPEEIMPNIKAVIEGVESSITEFSNDEKQCIYDNIAAALTEASLVFKEAGRESWRTARALFAMVDFSLLSEDALEKLTEYILRKDHFFFYSSFIDYWYPIYQLLQYGTDSQKQRINNYLSGPSATGKTKYSVYSSLVSEHLAETDPGMARTQAPQPVQKNIPKCPTCGSTDIQKISAAGRVASTSAFGLASRKISKTFKCNNCGYMW